MINDQGVDLSEFDKSTFNQKDEPEIDLSEFEPVSNVSLNANIKESYNTKPEEQAEALKLSRRSGVPVEAVKSNKDYVQSNTDLSDFDPAAIRKDSPKTSDFISKDLSNAIIARDDLKSGSLQDIEKTYGNIVGRAGMLRKEVTEESIKQQEWIDKTTQGLGGQIAIQYDKMFKGAELGFAALGKANNRELQGRAGILTRDVYADIGFKTDQDVYDAINIRPDVLLNDIKVLTQRFEALQPEGLTEGQEGVRGAGMSMAFNAPSLLLALTGAGSVASLATMGAQIYGLSYGEGVEGGLDHEKAGWYALAQTLVEVGTEVAPTKALVNLVSGSGGDLRKKVAGFVINELAGEQIATFAGALVDIGFELDEQMAAAETLEEKIAIQLRRQRVTFTSSLLSSGSQAGLGVGVNQGKKYFQDKADDRKRKELESEVQEEAVQQADIGDLDELDEKIRSSKTKDLDSETFMQFINAVDADSEKNVYIDDEKLYEYLSTKTPSEIVADPTLKRLVDLLNDSEEGVDVTVGLREFAGSISGTDHYAELREHIHINEDSASLFRQTEVREDRRKEMQEYVDKADRDSSEYVESAEIFETVKDQLIDTGEYKPQYADVLARFLPAYMVTKAKSEGKTVTQVYEELGLRIEGPQTGEAAQQASERALLEQAVTEGYEGDNRGEAQEWSAAVAKGLDMTADGRMQRAYEAGYDTETVMYHGTSSDIRKVDLSKTQSRDSGFIGKGVYLTSAPRIADFYANTAEGNESPNVVNVFTRVQNTKTYNLADKGDFSVESLKDKNFSKNMTDQLIAEGFDSAQVVDASGAIIEMVVFDPANIRSVNAAFDPDFADTNGLLNQDGVTLSDTVKYPLAPRSEWWGDADFESRDGNIVMMNPQRYLDSVRPLEIDDVTLDNVADLKNYMMEGRTLDPLAIYEGGKEDGRHRALAAIDMGITEVPVILFGKQNERFKDIGEGNDQRTDRQNDRQNVSGEAATPSIFQEAIARTDQQIDTAITDAIEGKEVAFVHRSFLDFDKFDSSKLGENTTTPSSFLGFFFSATDNVDPQRYGDTVSVHKFTLKQPLEMSDTSFETETADLDKEGVVEFKKQLIDRGFDGIVITGINHAIVFDEGSIQKVRDDSADDLVFEQDNLIVTHNLSAENILAAADLGGLAAPSIATVRSDISEFDNFGEVSLLADPSLLESDKARTFDADIYSPRQPRPVFDINMDKFRELRDQLKEIEELGLSEPDIQSLEGGTGPDNLQRSNALKYLWLKEQGQAPKPKNKKIAPTVKKAAKLDKIDVRDPEFQKIAKAHYQKMLDAVEAADETRVERYSGFWFNEDGTVLASKLFDFEAEVGRFKTNGAVDSIQLREAIDKKFRVKKTRDAYDKWAADKFNGMVDSKKLFKGFTPSGNRKYIDYNMQNVVKEMTQQLQAGESSFYGAGTVRSKFANEMKTIKKVQAKRDEIVTEADMQIIKDESADVFSQALDDLKPFYKFDADSWGYGEDAGTAIMEGRKGLNEAFNMTPESQKIVNDLVEYLVALPSSYFETKIQRSVQFSEFDTAVVPSGMNKDALQVLKDAGLKIKTYDSKGKGKTRQQVIAEQKKLLFQKSSTNTARGYYDPAQSLIRLTEDADLSTFLHEFAHFMLETELTGNTQIAKDAGEWFKRNAADVAAEANGYAGKTGPLEQDNTLEELIADFDRMFPNGVEGQLPTRSQSVAAIRKAKDRRDELNLPASRDRAAGYTPERVKSLIKRHQHANGLETKARVAFIDPIDFVAMTHSDVTEIEGESTPLDVDKLKGQSDEPYIRIQTDGRIIGHEGRHRAMAMAKAGFKSIPVVITQPEYTSDTSDMNIRGQQFDTGEGIDLTVKNAIPILSKNANKFTGGDLLFQAGKIRGQESSATTQVATTGGTYAKAANKIKDLIPEGTDVLDYGAGLGLGSDAIRGEVSNNVDSYEPFPQRWKSDKPVTYSDSSEIKKKYGGLVNMNVLNVLEPELRDVVTRDMLDKLANNGVAIIGARKFKGDVAGAKNFEPANETNAIWVKRKSGGKEVKVYQRGFDGDELLNYVKGIAGSQFEVTKVSGIAATSVMVRRVTPTQDPLYQSTTPEGQAGSITAEDVVAYVDNKTSGDKEKDKHIRRATHEQFARGFEQYVMESKSPSVELRDAFRKAAKWIVEVYKTLTFQKVNLDEGIRDVFDRLLATEEQLESARDRARMKPLFTDATMAGMTDEEYAKYLERQGKQKDKQSETLREKVVRELRRKEQAWWNRERDDLIDENIESLRREPVYRATEALKSTQSTETSQVEIEESVKAIAAVEKQIVKLEKDNDTLGKLISKNGGLNRIEMQAEGIDPVEFKKRGKVFGKVLFPKTGGMTVDGVAELLNERGFEVTSSETLDLIVDMLDDDTMYIDQNVEAEIGALADEIAMIEEQISDAQEVMRTTNIKLDHATVKDEYGEDRVNKRGKTSRVIPNKLIGMTAKGQDGSHPDEVAGLFGFNSGSEMIHKLINEPKLNEAAATMADQQMLEKHGDIMNDGTIEQMADDIVQDDMRGEIMLRELKALNKGTNRLTLQKAEIKQAAKDRISKLSYRQINAAKYRRGEIKEAQKAARFLAEGDKEAAARAKTQQVTFHYLALEATEARNEADKIVTTMSRYGKKKVREEIQKAQNGYWEQITKILSRFEFRKSATLKSVDVMNENIRVWAAERLEIDGDQLVLSNEVLEEGYIKHWKDLPYSELEGVRDSVKNIEHVARYANKIRIGAEEIEYKKFVNRWVGHIGRNDAKFETKNSRKIRDDAAQETLLDQGRRWASQLTKIPYLASWLDGGERVGMSHDALMTGVNDALDAKLKLLDETTKPIMDLIDNRTKADKKRHAKEIYVPEIDNTLAGHQILAVALNVGNQGNLRKLLMGEGWAEDDSQVSLNNKKLQAVLKHMNKNDWEFVQVVWDQMNTLYPQLAEVHRKTTGLVPPQVQSTPVVTPYGTFRGGYYPVKYSPQRSHQADKNKAKEDAQVDSLFSTESSIQSSVTTGATQERTGFYDRIRLDINIVPEHFNETIHYITHHDAIRQLNKLIRDPQVANAITAVLGEAEFKQLAPWLNDIAKDGREGATQSYIDDLMGRLRFGVTLGTMGFSASTGIMQVLGLFNTASEVGIGSAVKAVTKVVGQAAFNRSFMRIMGNTKQMESGWEFAVERSKVLDHRMETMDREIRNAMSRLKDQSGVLPWVQETSMKHIALIQTYMIDLVTWHAAYDKGVRDWGDEVRAAKYADWAVENLQGSGATKDMAALLRNQNKIQSTFTMFMTYFSAMGNYMRDTERARSSGLDSPTTTAAKVMLLLVAPVMAEMLLRGEFDEPEEEDERLSNTLTKIALYPMTSIPFARDVVSGLGTDFGYNTSPVASMLERGIAGTKSLIDGTFDPDKDVSASAAKNASKLAGAYFGVPLIGQAWKSGEHLYDVVEEGEDFTVREILLGPDRK